MFMTTITISRQPGSLGDEIASAVAREINGTVIAKEYFEEQFHNEGLSEDILTHYDEKNPNFWHSLAANREKYFHYMAAFLYESAEKGSCVILGRGGQVLLRDVPGVVKVRVLAKQENRVNRLREKHEISREYAEKVIQEVDHNREGFHRKFFQVLPSEAELYDLILNTSKLSLNEGVQIILAAVKEGEVSPEPIRDLFLEQRSIISIRYEKKIPAKELKVTVRKGIATLEGYLFSKDNLPLCTEVVGKIKGIGEVVNRMTTPSRGSNKIQ